MPRPAGPRAQRRAAAARTCPAPGPGGQAAAAATARLSSRPLRIVLVEAATRFLPEVAGVDHPPQERAGPVLRIAETVVEDLEDGKAGVEADEVGERQGAHRVAHAEGHD